MDEDHRRTLATHSIRELDAIDHNGLHVHILVPLVVETGLGSSSGDRSDTTIARGRLVPFLIGGAHGVSPSCGDVVPNSGRARVLAAATRFVITFGSVMMVYFVLPWSPVGPASRTALFVAGAPRCLRLLSSGRSARSCGREPRACGRWWPSASGCRCSLTIFAAAYALLSQRKPESFSEPLDRESALYFSIVVFHTVGFGDIAPVSAGSRLLVSAEILLNLAFLALVVRAFFATSRVTSARDRSRRAAGTEAP